VSAVPKAVDHVFMPAVRARALYAMSAGSCSLAPPAW
jgi:hypothetical protein